jgi:hypothetical protein
VDRSSIKTFNSAKKFAEEILHPLMNNHKDAKIRSRLGAVNDEEAMKLTPGVRVIKRFNAMKERIIYQQALLTEVESTVRLNGRKSEIELIEELSKQLSLLEDSYDERSSELIIEYSDKLNRVPELTPLFKQMGQYLDKLYVQLQRIMTKNKLLFFGEYNEFLDNEDLMERIKSENRSS